MTAFYAYSLLPVLSVALLLFFTAVRAGSGARGLAAFCLALATWSGMLLLLWFPGTPAYIGERLAAVGAFVAAGYLHAAYETTRQPRFRLVWLAYAVAAAITLGGVIWPGVIYGPLAMAKGPLFWPIMALAAVAAIIPLYTLASAYRIAPAEEKPRLRRLFVAGMLADVGGMMNAILLAHGAPVPVGMFLVLAGLLVLANVIREHEAAAERKLLERSLLYSAITAFLSAGFLFGVLALSRTSEPFFAQYRLGALLLFFTALLAFEPVRLQIQEILGRKIIKHRTPATEVARALVREEARADQAARLAELGTFASAVAHEVRNPLGILSAHVKLLERAKTADRETLASMQEQIDRAARFVDDLLKYGRPRPLELRIIDVAATIELAISTAKQGLGKSTAGIELSSEHTPASPLVEADQAQISQVLVILLDNALLALDGAVAAKRIRVRSMLEGDRLSVTIEDSGPGISAEVAARLFSPFVTGRKREGPRPGTGLGLAIARGIIERHHGTITAGRSEDLGGARFELVLPRAQPLL